ncbi:hypothetical protein [Ruegeria hyattellae]|uniref:hypothetical protein n=1 Tax=Ruegeria hyattellae TaxID=3233337 RepID=UPI00355C664E
MRGRTRITTEIVAVCGLLVLAGGASAAENEIENPLDTVNKHFEAASKDFGGGLTQLHARKEGADGTEHLIYHFDCSNNRYDLLSSDAAEPDTLPEVSDAPLADPFGPDDPVAPLAQHTCTKYGYPLLEW